MRGERKTEGRKCGTGGTGKEGMGWDGRLQYMMEESGMVRKEGVLGNTDEEGVRESIGVVRERGRKCGVE